MTLKMGSENSCKSHTSYLIESNVSFLITYLVSMYLMDIYYLTAHIVIHNSAPVYLHNLHIIHLKLDMSLFRLYRMRMPFINNKKLILIYFYYFSRIHYLCIFYHYLLKQCLYNYGSYAVFSLSTQYCSAILSHWR